MTNRERVEEIRRKAQELLVDENYSYSGDVALWREMVEACDIATKALDEVDRLIAAYLCERLVECGGCEAAGEDAPGERPLPSRRRREIRRHVRSVRRDS